MSSMQSLIGDKNFSVIKISPMRAARWQEFSHGENFHVFGNMCTIIIIMKLAIPNSFV